MNDRVHELSVRLERLERQNRRMKRAGLCAALGLGLLGLAGAAAPICDVLTGERLVLRDESGRTRVTLDAYRTETPALALSDKSGRVRARLGLDDRGDALLTVLDEKGAVRGTHRFGADAAPATRSSEPAPPPKKDGDPSVAMR